MTRKKNKQTTYLLRCSTNVRVITHRTGLGVVVCTRRVQVDEVLRRVLTDTQVPYRNPRLRVQFLPHRVRTLRILVLILVLVLAAPPNTIKWQTLGSASSCSAGGLLDTLGFQGQPGQACASLPSTAASAAFLSWTVSDASCTVELYAEAGCDPGELVVSLGGVTGNEVMCAEVPGGFRALDVVCA